MIVWVLTYNDGDYYSTYDEFKSVHATKEEAQVAAEDQAQNLKAYDERWSRFSQEIGEWVACSVADRWSGYPEGSQMQYKSHTWYVAPHEIGITP
jgi:hypothetical protein